MSQVVRSKSGSTSLFAVALLALACSATDSDVAGEATTPELAQQDEVGTLAAPLNSGGTCPTAAPDRTYTERFKEYPGDLSPTDYGITDCTDAYFVDINDFRGKGDHIVSMAAPPSTPGGCEKSRLMVYAWEKNANGSVTYLGAKTKYGSWGPSSCQLFYRLENEFPLEVGKDYHFATSARHYTNTGTWNTKRLRFYYSPPCCVPVCQQTCDD